ncbi:ribosomal protein S12 methylthiotransferase RimO [Clostridium pasteurianum DSM 525 = ATCC 6013]|uniref:Ribosomal protein uS12 methylthiotransferase RimO n=1 Tax=Clostridium pasteurianum DSM 525 = ATCC 6013 TaxID=1262449 RepID=A0A0H3J4Y8_CLOPA|nr:30S ribosomal protein S12 methylthiotransferase RimO [Clostridium pasteurianum]AJA48097.1 ribosomal protein S12 methylthiotransferase RimO [Clostridium pasteurianum DSM 525 = ATCC 6013]AJA52085.1 ribosomal protein S12 methylthiotransferase RimO [Clostridium pasteurianum DSM 525 = ATCC 6013]AOZ75365.1 ribosomal protein S12 methylthiotransferase RimO [Clostridium pasteurianum DSM 525 = ATCC 6013]AOZ79160.1 ribosomal protein S12 methylthiotransferase RimO [Clostridium pasteurianum]ELP60750.1 F
MNKLNFGLISLGCDKNRIDSETILGNIEHNYEIVNDPKKADIILVNTCGFIEASKQESINTILEMAEYKSKYNCKMLIATGCLTQRYGDELLNLMPELDLILGVNDYNGLNDAINNFFSCGGKKQSLCNYSDKNINEGKRIVTTGSFSAYVRISEGCNNSCSYCIIPKIRGKYRSRTMEDIIDECNELNKQGVKEIILVAQDTTRYGIDIYNKKMLPELLRKISRIKSIEWIRILYCYPEEITEELIEEISVNDKVCKYIDIPIQHISNNILKNMKRHTKKDKIIKSILNLKGKVENICLRTSIIVGFPGETEEDFQELKEFIKFIRFDKLGVFKYSREEDTEAFNMPNQIDESVKEQRQEELMLMQQQISKEINKSKIGNIYKVIIEGKNDNDYWYGRNYEMSPEIDGEIFFKCDKILNVGDFTNIKIIDSLEYDLIGVVCDESC